VGEICSAPGHAALAIRWKLWEHFEMKFLGGSKPYHLEPDAREFYGRSLNTGRGEHNRKFCTKSFIVKFCNLFANRKFIQPMKVFVLAENNCYRSSFTGRGDLNSGFCAKFCRLIFLHVFVNLLHLIGSDIRQKFVSNIAGNKLSRKINFDSNGKGNPGLATAEVSGMKEKCYVQHLKGRVIDNRVQLKHFLSSNNYDVVANGFSS
jgi:hypothetical protein